MRFQLMIAKRFMLGGRGSGPSRLTGWISIIGMMVGTFAMIISLAVMNGFEERVINKLIGFEGDIRITGINKYAALEQAYNKVKSDASIDKAMLYKERIGMIIGRDDSKRMATFKAVELEGLDTFYDIEFINKGMKTSNPEIVIGNLLAQRLNVDIGDQLTIMSPIDQTNFFGLPQMIDVTVSRIFHAQVLDFDDRVVFISPDVGNRLFLRKQNYDGIDIRLVDRKNLVDIKMQLEKTFSDHLSIKTWEDLHRGLISAMRVERLGALVVLCLIILVASFNLVSTLVLVIIQKIREIGILRAIGTSRINIKKIILTQGSLIGGVGAVIGIGISTALIFIQNQYGIIPLPADVYFISQLPMVITPIDLLVVPIIAFFFILFSGLIASRRATMIGIRESLQWEK